MSAVLAAVAVLALALAAADRREALRVLGAAMARLEAEQKIDADLVVPNPKTTLRKGAVAPWAKSSSPYYGQTLEALSRGLTQKMLHGAMAELHAGDAESRERARHAIEHFFLRGNR